MVCKDRIYRLNLASNKWRSPSTGVSVVMRPDADDSGCKKDEKMEEGARHDSDSGLATLEEGDDRKVESGRFETASSF